MAKTKVSLSFAMVVGLLPGIGQAEVNLWMWKFVRNCLAFTLSM